MNQKIITGAVSGAAGSVGGGLMRARAPKALEVAGFDLGPTLAAGTAGVVGALLTKGSMLSGLAAGAAGDAIGRLVVSLIPALGKAEVGGINAAGAGVGAVAGIGVSYFVG